MIKITDHLFYDNKISLILYVSQLLAYVHIIVDRHEDLPKVIEKYRNVNEIRNYLNQPLLNQ
jgi:hypothetical protein